MLGVEMAQRVMPLGNDTITQNKTDRNRFVHSACYVGAGECDPFSLAAA